MKDLSHHKGHVQKKVLRQARREEMEKVEKKDWEEKELSDQSKNPEHNEHPHPKKRPPVTNRRAREFH